MSEVTSKRQQNVGRIVVYLYGNKSVCTLSKNVFRVRSLRKIYASSYAELIIYKDWKEKTIHFFLKVSYKKILYECLVVHTFHRT